MRKIVFIAMGAIAFAGGQYCYTHGFGFSGLAFAQAPGAANVPSPTIAELTALSDRFESVAKAVLPAVVSIEARKPASGQNAFGRTTEDSGTGVIVSAHDGSGYIIITNNHVIAGSRADQIYVNLADGRLLRPIAVLGDTETDVAVLKIDSPSLAADSPHLTTAKFGDSDRCRIGQWVLALGSPFGLSQSLTHGIISARERGQVSLGKEIRVKDFLQTDAAINPGSSGGPLINLNGEVIGINTAIASQSGSSAGVSFSIPSNLVKRVAKQLLERGVVSHGYLGLQLSPNFEPADAVALGLDRARGAKIDAVMPESPAAKAGIRANDVVLQIDSIPVRHDNHLINIVSSLPAGQKVRLQVWRERKTLAIDAVVGDWTAAKIRSATPTSRP